MEADGTALVLRWKGSGERYCATTEPIGTKVLSLIIATPWVPCKTRAHERLDRLQHSPSGWLTAAASNAKTFVDRCIPITHLLKCTAVYLSAHVCAAVFYQQYYNCKNFQCVNVFLKRELLSGPLCKN